MKVLQALLITNERRSIYAPNPEDSYLRLYTG